MDHKEINDPQLKALFVEVASVKMLMRVIIQAMLPADQTEARKEIEALIKGVETITFRGRVGGLEAESSDRIVQSASQEAIRFLRLLTPDKSHGH